MEFKDLPKEIQEIAAHALRQRLNEVELESATKKDIDNMARNVRDAFTGMYEDKLTSDNQNFSPKFTPHPGGVSEIYHETMVKALHMQIAEFEHKLKSVSHYQISTRQKGCTFIIRANKNVSIYTN